MGTVRQLILGESTRAVLVDERELTRRRIVRALDERARYRYVHPQVRCTDDGWLITSPCCSRNVDPEGGVIDIARIAHADDTWTLHVRDHTRDEWVAHGCFARLDRLLDFVCRDPQRVIWP